MISVSFQEWEIGPEACENGEQGALARLSNRKRLQGPSTSAGGVGVTFFERAFESFVTNADQRNGTSHVSCTRRVRSSKLAFGAVERNSYLVDPASSHMLVSKIKPCMSKYKQICTVKLRMAH